MLNGLSLFSGIGAIDVALSEWVRTIAYCEIEPYCQGVLLSRMYDGLLHEASIWDDIRTFNGKEWREAIDIIFGGFPCQDISVAGHGKGLEGERSGLFFEIVRLCREIQPRYIFLENVPAITHRGGKRVVGEITALGYDCRWCVISAASVGALHRRERWFLLAHAKYDGTSSSQDRRSIGEIADPGRQQQQEEDKRQAERTGCLSSDVADSMRQGSQNRQEKGQIQTAQESTMREHWDYSNRELWQKTVSEMGKCSDGVAFHVDRLRALGNSCVPAQAKKAFEILIGLEK